MTTQLTDDLRFSRRTWLYGALSAAAVPVLNACGDPSLGATGDEGDDENLFEEVTDVSHTLVKNQSIGNCWAYAAAGWAESLHRARTGNSLDISESWITFWDWFDKIRSPSGLETTGGRLGVSTGGWWDSACNTMRNRGVVMEGDFIPEEAMASRSSRQSSALAAINEQLNGMGTLATPEARRNRRVVLEALMSAWQLRDEAKQLITRVFGAEAYSSVQTTRERNLGFLKRVTEIQIQTSISVRSTDGTVRRSNFNGTLNDVIPGGRYAFRAASYPTSASARADFHKRVMRALNDKQPILMSWLVDFNARGTDGSFKLSKLREAGMAGRQGGHLVTTEDYQVRIEQPGMAPRTLRAGEMASRADMDLAERFGVLEFVRIKNSWGTAAGPVGAAEFGGYHDLYMDYLNGPITWTADMGQRTPWSTVTLPFGY